jgi:hypothetical protein
MRWLLIFPFLLLGSLVLVANFPRPGAEKPTSGQVVDTKGPVAGAQVRCQGVGPVVVTDALGRFQLTPSSKACRVTAWKEGYSIAGTPQALKPWKLQLLPLPREDFEDYQWVDPTPKQREANNCGNCHQEIYREWHASAHSQAATNRRLRNLFTGTDWQGRPSPRWNLAREHPLGSGVCAACHAPTFRDPELDYDLSKVTGVAAHGVHCDYCHKILGASTDHLGRTFGKDGYDLLRPRGGQQLFLGPLPDAYREGEVFGYAPLYKKSRYCASCHEGVIFGVPVYGTYSEWLKSPARKQGMECQTCHMRPTGTLTNIAPGKGGVERDPQTLASHKFPGATADLLRSCLSVEVKSHADKVKLVVHVTVQAHNVGHRVPTGFIDRHLALVVEAADPAGKTIPLVHGPRIPTAAGKGLAGLPGALYAKVLCDHKGQAPLPFWVPHASLSDNRLRPEVADDRTFVFGAGASSARVRLLYRRFWQDVADYKGWPDNEIVIVDRRLTLTRQNGHSVESRDVTPPREPAAAPRPAVCNRVPQPTESVSDFLAEGCSTNVRCVLPRPPEHHP